MRIVLALVAATFATTACTAGTVVRQMDRANVFGLVQAGPRPSQVEVEQRGAFNVLGVVQATPDAGLTVGQRGIGNAAVVRQFGPVSAPWRGGMP